MPVTAMALQVASKESVSIASMPYDHGGRRSKKLGFAVGPVDASATTHNDEAINCPKLIGGPCNSARSN